VKVPVGCRMSLVAGVVLALIGLIIDRYGSKDPRRS
jgi:hypothetical protein